MTVEEKVELEHRLTEMDARCKSNTKRLNEHDEVLKQNSELLGSIKELTVETRYMREELNKTSSDLGTAKEEIEDLKCKDSDKWDKFKWLILAGLVTIFLGFVAVTVGLK